MLLQKLLALAALALAALLPLASPFLSSSATHSQSKILASAPSTPGQALTIKITTTETIGLGSYGIVYPGTLTLSSSPPLSIAAKRSLTLRLDNVTSSKETSARRYLSIERSCNAILAAAAPNDPLSTHFIPFHGEHVNDDGQPYLLFSYIDGPSLKARPSLGDLVDLLTPDSSGDGSKVDSQGLSSAEASRAFDNLGLQLCEMLTFVHANQIVHRDIKPENLLVSKATSTEPPTLRLTDFGSAASLKPSKSKLTSLLNAIRGSSPEDGYDPTTSAVSPIYCAPELFLDRDNSPYAFDVFSAAIIWCSYALRLRDVKQVASFKQQLELSDYELNFWLQTNFKSTVLSDGFEEGLTYLSRFNYKPWRLLRKMLAKLPSQRPSAAECLKEIMSWADEPEVPTTPTDGGPSVEEFVQAIANVGVVSDTPTTTLDGTLTITAQFKSGKPLGFILCDDAMRSGVFVSEILPRTQASRNGRVKVGDRLVKVGDVKVKTFAQSCDVINSVPSAILSMTFERVEDANPIVKSRVVNWDAVDEDPYVAHNLQSVKFRAKWQRVGSFTNPGRRKFNEDKIMSNVGRTNNVMVVGGVFDGHGGDAASEFCKKNFLRVLEEKVLTKSYEEPYFRLLDKTWKDVAEAYVSDCSGGDGDNCEADYDSLFGIVKGYVTGLGMSSGTTATVCLLNHGDFHLLNCGDSRAVVYDEEANVLGHTMDHKPSELSEAVRLQVDGFKPPYCGAGGNLRVRVKLNDGSSYLYAVSRSLEADIEAREAGIVYDAQVKVIKGAEGSFCLIATDGFWDVFDNESAGDIVRELLADKVLDLNEITTRLCAEAINMGSVDNVSCVLLLYVDNT